MTRATIQWSEAEPDVSIRALSQLLRESSWVRAIALIRNALAGTSIYLTRQCETAINAHLATESYELGGLLLGRVFKLPFPTPGNYPWLTLIETALPSQEYSNSSVSLRMEPELWTRAAKFLQRGLMVVGWYHSHPNLGVFFSATDRATQAAFFNYPYALGIVIDPVRSQRKCFLGGASQEAPPTAVTLL